MDEPLIWVLLGRKAGDNTQVLALADALGLSYERKQISARSWELLPHLLLGATLAGIDQRQSSSLVAPWPDLVISAGRRNEPVARWIQQQSGGHAKLVHLGRPWSALARWDLIVTTGQYFLPRADNILHNQLPLLRLQSEQLAAAGEQWLPILKNLPRPWLALMVGGNSGRFVLTSDKAARLGRQANLLAEQAGGSLLITDSPRTPAASFEALENQLTVPVHCFRFGRTDSANPYLGYLALADEFVITGESMSMLAEAASCGKPLHIFDMEDAGSWWRHGHQFRFKPLSHRLAMRWGPQRMRRDIGKIQQLLVASGAAHWLSDGAPSGSCVTPDAAAELAATAERVQQLLKP
ncbi:nucleoside-diphosphate sugar epimerase [Halieaceae bacterium IMCC14734]|uniref:Nucleoside-diphosphate sugar epimerase n=1 Tax=Candidatus Litorirhabdus singularis TaxID=2518993 RepID=A0ABT3TM70_9GAMM|nr:mitochondrial fission ELM1 family protein [Candidatus Litorirhabdus singularis]MCX2982427.1 nucleoside-diphosphate sugar epimerase [Candidatus Litorirhabdus singularis]